MELTMNAEVGAILRVCGIGNYLHIGDGKGSLVFDLLKRSIDAYGIDSSQELVAANLERAPGRIFPGSLKQYPFKPESFDTIIIGTELFNYSMQDMPAVLNDLRKLTRRNLVLYFPNYALSTMAKQSGLNRIFWEKAAIAAGFRRHTRQMMHANYSEHENEAMGTLTFFERIPDAALEQFPMSWLLENRDLHMDMLREAGRRSDGHVARYVLAADRVHAGDTVLDAACGLGYGTAVLASCSSGANFIGVDIDPESISYAEANYASLNPAISYRACDITKLSFIPDHSIDVVVSFETIEHIENYDLFLNEIKRVLKPDGRIIGSVPNLWCDETGKDPNPHHYHVFDWKKLHFEISKYFIVDGRWSQVAGGGYKMHDGKREMTRVGITDANDVPAEWLIFSAYSDPRLGKDLPYMNPFSKSLDNDTPVHVNFEKYYDNAWIYRVIVQQGIRIMDDNTLSAFCGIIAQEATPGSPDHGAALCVLAYRILEEGNATLSDLQTLITHINKYDQAYDRNNPHAFRWAMSLYYVAGRLLLNIGSRDDALSAFLTCASMDPTMITPLLATKSIAARMYAGLILVGSNRLEDAREQFVCGIKEAHRVMQGDWVNIIGSAEQPLLFGLPEAAEVLHIASQCAEALNALDKQGSVPGYFWDRINTKYFGLVEWNRNLERENKKLRKEITELTQQKIGVLV